MLLTVGDSHCLALRLGYGFLADETRRVLEDRFGEVRIGPIIGGYRANEAFFKSDPEAGVSFAGGARSRFAEIADGEERIVQGDQRIFAFSLGFHIFGGRTDLLAMSPMWEKYSLLKAEGRQYMSEAVLSQIVLNRAKHLLNFCRALQSLEVSFFMLSAPPLSERFIKRCARFLTRPELLQLQRIYRAALGGALTEIGVPYFLPPEVTALDGVLRTDLEMMDPRDVHHGNAEYGRLFWEQIAGRVSTGELMPAQG